MSRISRRLFKSICLTKCLSRFYVSGGNTFFFFFFFYKRNSLLFVRAEPLRLLTSTNFQHSSHRLFRTLTTNQSCTADAVNKSFIHMDKSRKTRVHASWFSRMAWECPRRLAAGTLNSILSKLGSILNRLGRLSETKCSFTRKVNQYTIARVGLRCCVCVFRRRFFFHGRYGVRFRPVIG